MYLALSSVICITYKASLGIIGRHRFAPAIELILATLEPATRRLTGGPSVSRAVRLVAGQNRIVKFRGTSPSRFRLSLCDAACRPLPPFVGSKGQEKGNGGVNE
jgi:hypothetical protein